MVKRKTTKATKAAPVAVAELVAFGELLDRFDEAKSALGAVAREMREASQTTSPRLRAIRVSGLEQEEARLYRELHGTDAAPGLERQIADAELRLNVPRVQRHPRPQSIRGSSGLRYLTGPKALQFGQLGEALRTADAGAHLDVESLPNLAALLSRGYVAGPITIDACRADSWQCLETECAGVNYWKESAAVAHWRTRHAARPTVERMRREAREAAGVAVATKASEAAKAHNRREAESWDRAINKRPTNYEPGETIGVLTIPNPVA